MKRWLSSLFLIIFISTFALGGCSNIEASDSQTSSRDNLISENREITPAQSLPTLDGKATVKLKVNGEDILVEVDGENAPFTAGNFVDLVDRGFYNGLTFHRVVKQPEPFVVQGGDPQGNGRGGFIDPETKQRRFIPLEIKPEGEEEPVYSKTLQQAGITQDPVLKHTKGAIAMARSTVPDSASSQFYFALDDLGFLDGNYAVFGYVTEGIDVIDEINQGDTIESAEVISGLENLLKN